MNRVGNDELLAHPPNLTFKSSFSLSGGAIEQNSTNPPSTALCGLGWYFTLRIVTGNGLKKGQKSKKIGGRTIYVDINFDKAFIASTRYSIDCVACEVLRSDLDAIDHSFDRKCIPLATHNIGTLRIDTTRDYTIIFTVETGEHNSATPPTTMHQHIARAVSDTMRTGHFIDTKIYVYSQRWKTGARDPKVIWASSRAVHMFGSDDLSLLFAQDGPGNVPIDAHSLDEGEIDGYDYESDSDLEDDVPTPPIPSTNEPTYWSLDLSPEALPGSVPHLSRSRSISPVLLIPKAAPQSQSPPTSSPRILTPTNSSSSESSSSWTPSTPGPFAEPSFAEFPMSPSELLHQQALNSTNFLRMGRVLVLRDGAYRTWKALLHYVYFQDVEFARLRSDLESRGDSPTASEFQCSPKSMYRLAVKYGLDALKRLALQSIQQQLSTTNVIKELFSKFTSLYPEVMTLEMEFLMKNRSNDLVQRGLRSAIMRGQNSRVVGEIMVALLRG